MGGYYLRRLGKSLASLVAVLVAASLLATWIGENCSAQTCAAAQHPSVFSWLLAALHGDLGSTIDGQPVTVALGAAVPASALLLVPVALIDLLLAWSIGLSSIRRDAVGMVFRAVQLFLTFSTSTPVFWTGALLIEVLSVQEGWRPPGGIASTAWPAFGTDAYGAALLAHPVEVLSDLGSHMILPVLTLVLAGAALQTRMVSATVSSMLRTRWSSAGRGAGLPRRRIVFVASRAALPSIAGASAASIPLFLSALILVEYLYAWPGAGMLAYRAARAGDGTLLASLFALFGTLSICAHLGADLIAAWADPRILEAGR